MEFENKVQSFAVDFEVRSFAILISFAHILFLCRAKMFLKIWLQIRGLSINLIEKSFFNKVFRITLGEIICSFVLCLLHYIFLYFTKFKLYTTPLKIVERVLEFCWTLFFFVLNFLFSNILFFCTEVIKSIHFKFKKNYEVSNLILVYDSVISLSHDVNVCFGPALVISFIVTLLELINGFYITFNDGIFNSLTFWVGHFIFCTWTVLFACEDLTEQVILFF